MGVCASFKSEHAAPEQQRGGSEEEEQPIGGENSSMEPSLVAMVDTVEARASWSLSTEEGIVQVAARVLRGGHPECHHERCFGENETTASSVSV